MDKTAITVYDRGDRAIKRSERGKRNAGVPGASPGSVMQVFWERGNQRENMYTPILATLGYILSPDKQQVLMIHRNKRPNDLHYGK